MTTPQVHVETKEEYPESKTYPKQRVEVPVRYVEDVKLSYGRIRMITREITVKGTVEVEKYGRRRVEYGICQCKGYTLIVVCDGGTWVAVDRKEKPKS